MSPPSRRASPSLLPAIVLLSVVLLGLLIAIGRRERQDGPPAARAAALPAPGPTARPSASKVRSATAVLDGDAPSRDVGRWPLSGARARTATVPILMWHVVATPPAGTAYPELWVPPERFAAQVSALRTAGFTAITTEELWSAWRGSGRLPAHPVVLSFDDGDLTHVTNAAPVLARAGWPGVLNLAVNHLGPKGLPVWGARRLLREGWEIDSHTVDHLDLTALGDDALADQLARSRRLIHSRLGVTTRFLCYPAGRNDERVRAAARQAGYVAATTVDPGIASPTDDPFLLPRVRVDPETTPAQLVRQARGTAAPPVGTTGPS